MTTPAHGHRFRYDGYELDLATGTLVCRYSLGDHRFTEELCVGPLGGGAGGDPGGAAAGSEADAAGWEPRAADAAARLVFLLAGVSYYKTSAPPVVDLGDLATTDLERRFLRSFYVDGLAEFAYRNGLDLTALEVVGRPAAPTTAGTGSPGPSRRTRPPGGAVRPLVPFGGGIDSVVTAEAVRRTHPGTALFVVERPGDRIAAIERPAAVSGLPVVRATRRIDPAVLRSAAHGFLNGHVPVTGILSAVAVLAAVCGGYDAVVMSNERSASAATLERDGRAVNHQWSKSLAFETGFREVLAAALGDGAVDYFSYLRGRSELWVARRFAAMPAYHGAFHSCNRAFVMDPAERADRWCGRCDKCCFIDLVLAPWLDPARLGAVFDGREPLADESLLPAFLALVGSGAKPFECVGDVEECRAAVELAAARPDRAGWPLLERLLAEVRAHDGGTLGGLALGAVGLPGAGVGDRHVGAAAHVGAAMLVDERGPDFVPAPFDPAPFDPAPFDPAPFDPAPFDPAPFDPAPFDPAPFDRAPGDRAPGDGGPGDGGPGDGGARVRAAS